MTAGLKFPNPHTSIPTPQTWNQPGGWAGGWITPPPAESLFYFAFRFLPCTGRLVRRHTSPSASRVLVGAMKEGEGKGGRWPGRRPDARNMFCPRVCASKHLAVRIPARPAGQRPCFFFGFVRVLYLGTWCSGRRALGQISGAATINQIIRANQVGGRDRRLATHHAAHGRLTLGLATRPASPGLTLMGSGPRGARPAQPVRPSFLCFDPFLWVSGRTLFRLSSSHRPRPGPAASRGDTVAYCIPEYNVRE